MSPPPPPVRTPSLRRELVVFFGVLLAGALFVAAQALVFILPLLDDPADAIGLIVALIALDLAVVAGFGSWFLRSRLVQPMDAMVRDVQRIADGDRAHRVGPVSTAELSSIRDSVNAMADTLLANQEALAENVASLDRTNEELVAARDEVIQAARLASVGTLASGIAHEIGNPLGALVGFTDVARSRAARDGQDTELLDSIKEEARRIDRIVRTLLQYARGTGPADASVPLVEVFDRVRELLETQGKSDHARIEWPEDADSELKVPGEAQQVEQILVNLILNALDAMTDAGTRDPAIQISVRRESGPLVTMPRRREEDPPGLNYLHRRRVALAVEGGVPDPLLNVPDVVRIEVQDSGPGIPAENLDRVFDPFFTTKAPGKGTGLGLAICARLAEGMGGRILVENAAEGGARFIIRLPAVTQEDQA